MGACHRIGGDRVRMDRLPILECASERVLRRVDIFSNVAADRCQFQPVGACRHHVVGVYRGNGNQRPERALLLVLMVVSVFTAGHVATAVAVVFFLSAPLMVLSFWALAGIFTRSDTVRCVIALAWFAIALSMNVYSDADVTMMTVMVFLPAAFAFSFRAVGMYRTEDLVNPQASVQAAGACGIVLYSRRRGRTAIAAAADVVVPCVPDACTLP